MIEFLIVILGIICWIIPILWIFLKYKIAELFYEVAKMKGHGKKRFILCLCFFTHIVGILYVIALPDLHLRNGSGNGNSGDDTYVIEDEELPQI